MHYSKFRLSINNTNININIIYFGVLVTLPLRTTTTTLIITEITRCSAIAQRDHAAGCVIVFAKSTRLELGDNIKKGL